MGIEKIRAANPKLVVRSSDDPALASYGRLLDKVLYGPLAELADRVTAVDRSGNRYVGSMPELEAGPGVDMLSAEFGFAPIQVGYCNGPNSRLNGLEYHKSYEIDIAVTDLVLLLGKWSDIGPDGIYNSAHAACFYFEKGEAIELYPEVLHFSPCKVCESGFKSIIVLPRGTNEALGADELALSKRLAAEAETARARGDFAADAAASARSFEPRALFMKNKWLLAHPERTILVERGAWPGIRGENIEVKL